MARGHPSSSSSASRTALADAIRTAYPHGVEAVIAVVDAAFTTLAAEVAAVRQEIATVRRQLAADSRTSSKPPSTDQSRVVPPVSLRTRSGRRPGGQPGHPGRTLDWRADPETVVAHRPTACGDCGAPLDAEAPARIVERAQVVDLPPVTLRTTEHHRVGVTCTACGHEAVGAFPMGLGVGVHYGPEVRALAVALHSYHLLPYARTAEFLDALLGDGPSVGSLARWTREAALALAPAERAVAEAIRASPTAHADETGLHIARRRWWLHVASTATHTHYHIDERRGLIGMTASGVWTGFGGTVVHDAWSANFHLGEERGARHQLCLAHLRREAKGLYLLTEEMRRPEAWLTDMGHLLGRLHHLVTRAAAAGRAALDPRTVRRITARYDALLRTALRRHPHLVGRRENRRPGPVPRGKVASFADRLIKHRADVLRCASDATIPPDNNQAERDLRMMKVEQKVSGGFRTPDGARAFCILRSVCSSARKQGQTAIAVLRDVFASHPQEAPVPSG